ncbi:MAG: thiol reductase thioredoxin [Flavobacteriaceae bacterium]|nr:MAG: thiol reductase thioredoxin [Flavobacteriaceae bacterium]
MDASTQLIDTIEEYEQIISQQEAVLFYYSSISCGVAEALEPKVRRLIQEKFPKINYHLINLPFSKKICAAHSVFVEPTILVYFNGKESIRKSRNISTLDLEKSIARLYKIFFE